MLKSVANLNKKKNSLDSVLLINLTLAFFPISFIVGNLFINLNLVLFCILGIFHLKSKLLTAKYNLPIKIIFLFFLAILFSTSLSFIKFLYFEDYESTHLERLIKAILFFRFFLMLIIIYFLNEFKILNLKYFFISAAFSAFVVSLDVIYQYTFGFNIIGLESLGHHNSSFFGDEWIAGGFIQNFSFFSILFVTHILKNKKYLRFIFTTVTICIVATSILLSLNKMPLVLFFIGLLLAFLFDKKLRIIIPVSLLCIFVLFKLILESDVLLKGKYIALQNSFQLTIGTLDLENDTEEANKSQKSSEVKKEYSEKINFLNDKTWHGQLLLTALDTWQPNKIFGNGIKSFRFDCYELQRKYKGDLLDESVISEYNFTEEYIKSKKNRLCSTHPHNYYFEILTETGIVGLTITLIIAALFLVFILKNLNFLRGNNIENFILLAATISLFLEVFPFKSSGSLFTTNDAAYIILISSIIISHKKKTPTNSE